jgi:hypothetical protein
MNPGNAATAFSARKERTTDDVGWGHLRQLGHQVGLERHPQAVPPGMEIHLMDNKKAIFDHTKS